MMLAEKTADTAGRPIVEYSPEIRASIEPDIPPLIALDSVETRVNSWATDHQLGCDGTPSRRLLTPDHAKPDADQHMKRSRP